MYQKVSEFDANQTQATRALSQCKKGCSRCCYVDLTVFEVEAQNIQSWFLNLTETQKNELKQKWEQPSPPTACTFLKNDECTIYEVRPLICRTQGLALQFRENSENFLDICPLNEKMLEEIQANEILNLDLLNQILSQIEMQDTQGKVRPRKKLASLIATLHNSN